jgi:hypothetical protein
MPYNKGQSGNLNGRPKGARYKLTALRDLLTPRAKELVNKSVELAKSADTTALRLCLERLIPPMHAKDEPVELGQMTGTLADQGQAIVDASITGRIAPSEASALMQALMAQVRVVDADEVASRLGAIEQKVNRTR